MRTLLLIFTCKRPKYTDIVKRGLKAVNFCERPLWTWPLDLYFLFFSSGLALVPAYLHSGVMNGVTTGMGGAKFFLRTPNDPLPALFVLNSHGRGLKSSESFALLVFKSNHFI